MFNKDQLLKISELDKTNVEQLTDEQMTAFAATANSLIDNFPSLAENIKTALEAKDFAVLEKLLTDTSGMLRQIFAEKLAEECSCMIKTINDIQYADLQAYVITLLKTVSALSIDLQMAEFRDISEQPDSNAEESAAKNTILAVDDRHFFLTSIKTMLQDTGYKVTCINSGTAALNYLKNHRPDLFILDIEMPEMDGYELAVRVRASGQTAPIIFLTGNAKKDSVVKAIKAGAADFIIKPVTKDQLLERIGKYIAPELEEEQE